MSTSIVEYGAFVESAWVKSVAEKDGLRDLYIMSTGLPGETGEVCEKLKKYIRDGNIDPASLLKELGDVLYYTTKIAHYFGFDLQQVMDANVEKILGRRERGTLRGSGDDR